MDKNTNIVLVRKPTFKTRLQQAAIIVTGTALASYASAASSIDASGLTDEIDGVQTIVIGLFGVAITILGMFAGWRYLKRGANSA